MIKIDSLEEQAIDAALKTNWQEAILLNKKILDDDKENIAALLRIGFAYLQLGRLADAKKYYRRVKKIQPANRIASDTLDKIKVLESKKRKIVPSQAPVLDPKLFLDVPGKTKTIKLVNLGQKIDLARLTIGQEVFMKLKKRHIEIRTLDGKYIGTLPDDISRRLEYFIKQGSEYVCHIKETSLNEVVVFIREVKKGKKVQNYPSFPQNANLFMADIQQTAGETAATDEDTDIEDEWLGIGSEPPLDERDSELERLHQQEDEEEEEEE